MNLLFSALSQHSRGFKATMGEMVSLTSLMSVWSWHPSGALGINILLTARQ